ncbi:MULTISPECIES: TetR/AcrR family transcriptional regulator [Streptomyces]|jgi:AcrR family transcriptional regulator|uniref:TetR/AcrR family transcriptional regulator n=1 Tax=unclassified Streptomyces TaxID=2593676 RepID=UPI0008917331|nr:MULTISPECIES: TetR/AcrR family transcriptional regulator [unclassified Streptomyces]MDX2731443.1 TetR/AcrR family transcriptional regulator [Streptomyces sp. PA03-2a]MDX3768739.1 TetR/AcrR family transcriptional regulator [Streptomyces sp. AK08-01B]MDX3818673.1 TetR/AcrR family transcriptional regulator [Streptomyces sp. AK08-01A]SCX87565.1 DNA-binding transcriptional regulator, AcrR family [Streptomyces sp. 136MFCol5.1]SFS46286.1 transcriptional regulator, TetR family [Streptomyces sp. ok2
MSSHDSVQEPAHTPRRSKITPERAQEFYTAVLELLRESGYESLTMEGVASRTRCGKSTLYRQWGSKPELVVAALHSTRQMLLSHIDTGTLAGDLREAARAIGARSGSDTPLMHALSHAALQSPELLCALREALILPELAAIDAMVRRGMERGEITADNAGAEFVSAQLLGVMRARPLLEAKIADEAYLTRFVESAVFPSLGLDPATTGS